ncbi:MAG: ubiquinol-cytochrome c reductase iron-sulfur subunit [Woeseiaceae bacterium]|nr:ubiquinol-cytochrome c reductase iron-sulfur subunit [Woeseiaceae bacterium]
MADVDPVRRSFLARMMQVLGGVAVLEAGWIAVSALVPRRRTTPLMDGPGVTIAGPVQRFELGSVTAFGDGKFYLARLEDGGFLAVHRKCTHLGCSVPWIADEKRFACPCHASAFDIHGDVINAPAPRPLDLFPVTIENGIVKVDTGRLIRRKSFEPSQAVRA